MVLLVFYALAEMYPLLAQGQSQPVGTAPPAIAAAPSAHPLPPASTALLKPLRKRHAARKAGRHGYKHGHRHGVRHGHRKPVRPLATLNPPVNLPPGGFLAATTPAGHTGGTTAEIPFRLRLQPRLLEQGSNGNIGGKLNGNEPRPTFLTADQLSGRQEDRTDASGNVELRKLGTRLLADQMTYWPQGDEVEARGNVRLEQGTDRMSGPLLRQKLSEQSGFFEKPAYIFQREIVTDNSPGINSSTVTPALSALGIGDQPQITRRISEAHGVAEQIEFKGQNQRYLTQATYSSCSPSSPDWYTRAEQMHLDYDRNLGSGKHATVYFKDAPIFYTPYLDFSLNGQRKSGLLPPIWAASTRNGFDFTLPYYVNLSPNYDLTLYPRSLGKRGMQLGGEFRYLNYNYNGEARFEYLPNDQVSGKNRYSYSLRHNHLNLGRGFSGTLNLNGVSDDQYWTDLTSSLVQTTQTQLPRHGQLNYASGTWWNANMQVLQYQTLQPDPKVPIGRPYFMEPQFNFNGRLPDFFRTDLTLTGQFTRFTHPTQVQGNRTVAYPQLALPLVTPGYYLTPKIGFHVSQYNLSQQTPGEPTQFSRTVPIASVDAGMTFERETNLFGRNMVQTLEPRLFYVNIPYHAQQRMPVFDSGLADFNFAQIFSENRYVGQDRIGDANQLTAALTTRLIDPTTGAERLKAMIGQRQYFSSQRVTLPGEVARNSGSSNILAAFNTSILPKTYIDAALEYDYQHGYMRRLAMGAKYQPGYARAVSATYRAVRDAGNVVQTDQIDFAAQWPIRGRWYGVGRYNYDLRSKRVIEGIAGVEYNAGCWAGRFVVQQLTSVGGVQNTTYFFQLELNDFAQIGSSPLQLLRRSVPGYSKVNEAGTDDLINQ